MPNAIGTLNGIAKTIADKGVNILAVSAWVEGAQAVHPPGDRRQRTRDGGAEGPEVRRTRGGRSDYNENQNILVSGHERDLYSGP